jgi:hypothetical protein
MSFTTTTTYTCTCAICAATKTAESTVLSNSDWRKFDKASHTVYEPSAWMTSSGTDCMCGSCYTTYAALKEAADKAAQDALNTLDNFIPINEGDGTEQNPYTWVANVACAVAKFYTHDGKVYTYMPADAISHSYATWDEASADMVSWE